MQVRLQCQDRGNLMADLWSGMQLLVQSTLGDSEAARLKLASCAASEQALQAAMPLLLQEHSR